LTLNKLKISSTGNRKSTQHWEYIEELVNLLFYIEDEDFSDKITQKSYPKYEYQSVSIESKSTEKAAFFKAIHSFSEHSHTQNPAKKREYCIFYFKEETSKVLKETDFRDNKRSSILYLNQNLNEVNITSKKEKYRGKRTIW